MVSASLTAMSMTLCPLIETLIRPVPVVPISRAGTPTRPGAVQQRADVLARHGNHDARRRFRKQRRDRGPRGGASTGGQIDVQPHTAGTERALRERHREPSFGAVVRRSQQPFTRRRHQQLLKRLLRFQIDVGRHAGDHALHHLQVLAAAELMARLAEQHDRVAAAFESAPKHLARILDQADDAENRRRINRLPVGLVVQADVAAGNRDIERFARGGDAFDGSRRTAT